MTRKSFRSRMLCAALSVFMVLGVVNIPMINVRADDDLFSVSTWDELSSAITDAQENATVNIRLASDIETASNARVTIDEGKKVTIDLNGNDITKTGFRPTGSLFSVSGEDGKLSVLTIKDSSSGEPGKITGNKGTYARTFNISEYGELYLESGNISGNVNNRGAGVYINGGRFVMSGGIIENNTSYCTTNGEVQGGSGRGGGVYITGSGSFEMSGGMLRGNGWAHFAEASCGTIYGGGVYVDKDATFVMTGGTFGDKGVWGANAVESTITRYPARGGNVYVAGKFIMDLPHDAPDGNLWYGYSNSVAGGVYVADGGQFTMKGGLIGDSKGGNVYVDCGGSFVMDDGKIDNSVGASGNGNGVYINGESESVYGTFTMNGGTISDQSAVEGGAVHIHEYAIFTMNNGEIKGNSSLGDIYAEGGGVYVAPNAVFNMAGGSIKDNKAGTHGGGVYVDEHGTFNLSCGEITGNTVDINPETNIIYGAGIYLESNASLNLSGDGVINVTGNKNIYDSENPKEDNVFVATKADGTVIISDKVVEKSKIGLGFHTTLNNMLLTSGYMEKYGDADPLDIFNLDQDGYFMRLRDSEVQVYQHSHLARVRDFTGGDSLNVYCTYETSIYYTACEKTATLKISVPEPYYTGNPVTAKLEASEYFKELTGIDVDESEIKYYASSDQYNPLSAPPVDKGNYVAKYTVHIDGTDYTIKTSFEIRGCVVRFFMGGHGTNPGEMSVDSGSVINEPETPSAVNWVFGGWYTDSDFTEGNKFDFSTPITKDTYLYAKWTRCYHDGVEAEYDWADDGSSCNASYRCTACGFEETEAGTITPSLNKAETCASMGETKYTATFRKTTYFTTQDKIVADIAIDPDAHSWGETTYDWADDNSSCTAKRICLYDDSHVETDPATVSSEVTQEPTVTEEGIRKITATFTKNWASTQYKEVAISVLGLFDVTFDLQGVEADAIASQQIVEGQKVDKPDDPSSEEYEFAGWFKDYECTEAWDFDNDTVTAATTLYAKWKKLPDINFIVDFGEGHEDLVSNYYGSYPVDGSKVTFTVPAGTTLHDAMYGIPIKFNDIQDNGDWFYGLFEVGAFGLKPAKQYASKAEYIQELEDSKDVPITDGTTIYALWFTPVENLVLTVKAPDCGTVVNYDETATEYPYQDVVPEIDISGDAVLTSTVWLAEDYKTAGSQYYFDGRLTGDNTYFANFYLEAKFGYTFVFGRDITDFLSVKGATLSVADTGMVNEQNMGGLFSVTISHQPGEKAVENEVDATCTETGKYDEVVRCTGCKTVISSEPKTTAALGHDWSAYVVTTPAEVGKKGVETSTCSRCKKTQTRDIPAIAPSATPTATAAPTKASAVSLKLDKTKAELVCGKDLTLKATLKGSTSKITWKSSDKKVATVDANGKVTASAAGTVTITASVAGKKATCTITVLYKDVTNAKDFWFAPTNYLTAKGVVKGYDKQTKFKPANNCTRAQMVTFIWRLQGEPAPKATTCKFKDVKKSDYFYKACIWGNENHIVEGYKDGTFGPQIVCARKHAVTFLWRLAGKPAPASKTNKFKDVKTSDYFYKATLWASEKKILAGYDDGTFRPNGNCLRRQMVTFLYKYDKFVNGKG